MAFFWYRLNEYGCADVLEDTPAVRAAVDAGRGTYYGNAEGAIINGGVLATAFTRKVEQTYDARAWLRDGSMIPMGEIETITITAEPKHGTEYQRLLTEYKATNKEHAVNEGKLYSHKFQVGTVDRLGGGLGGRDAPTMPKS